MPVTDHHAAARDAVAATLKAVGGLPQIVVVDAAEDVPHVASLPAVVVFPLGCQNRTDIQTNARDGCGWEVGLALLSSGQSSGSKTRDVPSATQFRRQCHVSFNNKRLSGVTENCWCEVSESGELWDRDIPAYEKLVTAVVVTAVGRYLRS